MSAAFGLLAVRLCKVNTFFQDGCHIGRFSARLFVALRVEFTCRWDALGVSLGEMVPALSLNGYFAFAVARNHCTPQFLFRDMSDNAYTGHILDFVMV